MPPSLWPRCKVQAFRARNKEQPEGAIMIGLFTVVGGPDGGQQFRLQEDQILMIGRGPATQTRLKDPSVSRVHCVAEFRDGKPMLTDSGTASGTFVNDKQITEHQLEPGDVIRIGTTVLSFKWAGQESRFNTVEM